MSISEFRYNKKRKHYSYIFKKMGLKRKNILITSKPIMLEKKHKNNRIKTKMTINVVLFCHPNHSKKDSFTLYLEYISIALIRLMTWFLKNGTSTKMINERLNALKN